MEEKDIRLEGGKLKVCKHITIIAKEVKEDEDDYEYTESLSIICNQCKKEFLFNILIN